MNDKKKTGKTAFKDARPHVCWILKRLTPPYVPVSARAIFLEEKAEEIASHALQIIEETCKSKPVFFSSRSKDSLLSGLFYLLGIQHGNHLSIIDMAQELKMGKGTVWRSYRRWLKKFPEMFPDFALKPIGLGLSSRLTFKGRIV